MGKPLTGPQCFSAQLDLRPVIIFSIPVFSIVSGRDSLISALRICSFQIILVNLLIIIRVQRDLGRYPTDLRNRFVVYDR